MNGLKPIPEKYTPMAFKSILIFLPFISMFGESDQRHRSGIRLNISEYTLSDLGDLSNLIGSLSRTIQQYSPHSEWIMCALGFFHIFLVKDLSKVDKILGLTFFQARKDFEGFKTAVSIYCCWVLWSMDCLQIPFIRQEEAVSWTQRFLTRKIWPRNEVYLWQTNLKANFCRNSTFQVNTRKNATWRRRLTSRNRIAIFVSTSSEERHNKPFRL